MRKDYMKIKWIEFENLESGLKIERIDFFDDVTLLVGLSGVGKTQILNAISYSLALAVRRRIRLRPYCVKIGIQINENYYEWSYKIKHNDELDILTDDESEYIISDEELKKNNDLVFKRENNSSTVLFFQAMTKFLILRKMKVFCYNTQRAMNFLI